MSALRLAQVWFEGMVTKLEDQGKEEQFSDVLSTALIGLRTNSFKACSWMFLDCRRQQPRPFAMSKSRSIPRIETNTRRGSDGCTASSLRFGHKSTTKFLVMTVGDHHVKFTPILCCDSKKCLSGGDWNTDLNHGDRHSIPPSEQEGLSSSGLLVIDCTRIVCLPVSLRQESFGPLALCDSLYLSLSLHRRWLWQQRTSASSLARSRASCESWQ